MATFIFECEECMSLFEVEADINATEQHTQCSNCGKKYVLNPQDLYKNFMAAKKAKKKGIFKKLFGK